MNTATPPPAGGMPAGSSAPGSPQCRGGCDGREVEPGANLPATRVVPRPGRMQRLADELGTCARHHRLPGVAHDPQDYGLLVVRVGCVRVRVGFAGVLRVEIPRDEVDWLRLATVLRDLALAVERAFAEPHPTRKGD